LPGYRIIEGELNGTENSIFPLIFIAFFNKIKVEFMLNQINPIRIMFRTQFFCKLANYDSASNVKFFEKLRRLNRNIANRLYFKGL